MARAKSGTRATLPPESRSRIMRSIRSTNTKPELAVRKMAHAMGYRFRLHRADLPGRPDLVFPRLRRVVFVHGCFWHQHPDCVKGKLPRANCNYWLPKLKRNKARDAANQSALAALGWRVLVLWECELREAASVGKKLRRFLEQPAGKSQERRSALVRATTKKGAR